MNLAADEFVAEFRSRPNTNFIIELCASANNRINHRIWRGIVLPFVKEELNRNPAAIKCLIQTIQNLYSDRNAHAELGCISKEELIRQYLTFFPGDNWATTKLKETLSSWLAYTIHEWPSGVLYGVDGATIEQCDEIIELAHELNSLDDDGQYQELCESVMQKAALHQQRLRAL